jgi:hypothetical protein
MRLVGIEEHVNRANVMERMTYPPDALRAKLLPSVGQRISDMDAAGISVEVLSGLALNAAGAPRRRSNQRRTTAHPRRVHAIGSARPSVTPGDI